MSHAPKVLGANHISSPGSTIKTMQPPFRVCLIFQALFVVVAIQGAALYISHQVNAGRGLWGSDTDNHLVRTFTYLLRTFYALFSVISAEHNGPSALPINTHGGCKHSTFTDHTIPYHANIAPLQTTPYHTMQTLHLYRPHHTIPCKHSTFTDHTIPYHANIAPLQTTPYHTMQT